MKYFIDRLYDVALVVLLIALVTNLVYGLIRQVV